MSSAVNCGPFIGLNWVNISGGSYTDSYNSDNGRYASNSAGSKGHVCSNGIITLTGGLTVVHGDAQPGPTTGTTGVARSGGASVTGSTSALTDALTEPAVSIPADAITPGNLKTARNKNPVSNGDFTIGGGDTITLPAGSYRFGQFAINGG
jgi:hypothetical protein